MFSAIILVAAIGAGQQYEPLFPRLFPNPTSQNALEFYVRAADMASELRLEIWNPYLAETKNIPDRLEYEERMAPAIKRVLDLVRVGNQFPLRLPADQEPILALAGIKIVAKLALQYSRVQFVRGNPDEATDALLLLTEMSARLHGSGGAIQLLVAKIIDSIAFAGFHSAYTSISLNGANEILSRLELHDIGQVAGHWIRDIARVDDAVKAGDEQYDAKVWGEARPKALVIASKLEDVFAVDEGQWMALSTSLTKNEVPIAGEEVQPLDAPMAQTLVRVVVRNRTQRRLLRAHAHIAKYRWESGALPESLSDLPEEARFDPAAGQPFVYQRFSEAAYDLYSPGNQYHGTIRLLNYAMDMLRGNPGPP